MIDYYKPFYLPSIETSTPFSAEFKDPATMFFVVKYRIKKGFFKSRISGDTGPLMGNIFDYRGRDIFKNVPIDRQKYKLLVEDLLNEQFYDVVSETYGYAPNNVYKTFETTSVKFAGHTTVGGSSPVLSNVNITLDATSSNISFGALYKGDEAYFKRADGWVTGGQIYAVTSSVFVLSEDGKAPNPSWTADASGASVSTREVISAINPTVFPRLYLSRRYSPSRNDTVLLEKRTQYFETKPSIIPRTKLIDSLGNEVWDATNASVVNKYDGLYCVEDSAIVRENGLWRRDIKLTDWKIF